MTMDRYVLISKSGEVFETYANSPAEAFETSPVHMGLPEVYKIVDGQMIPINQVDIGDDQVYSWE